jgi:hypothetical protein
MTTVYFEWNSPEHNAVIPIDYNDHAALRQALNNPQGSVVYVIEGETLFKGEMPKGSSVQANRAKRYYDYQAELRQGKCPFEQNSEGKWVKICKQQ